MAGCGGAGVGAAPTRWGRGFKRGWGGWERGPGVWKWPRGLRRSCCLRGAKGTDRGKTSNISKAVPAAVPDLKFGV